MKALKGLFGFWPVIAMNAAIFCVTSVADWLGHRTVGSVVALGGEEAPDYALIVWRFIRGGRCCFG